MKTRSFLLAVPLSLVIVALVVVPALAWAKGGNIDCDEVMVRIRNDHGSHVTRYFEGWVKVDGVTVFADSGTVNWNQWATISWEPPVGTSGSVEAYVAIRDSSTSSILDSHTVGGELDCEPDYQLNLSHIECVEEGQDGNQVEVHFVLLNVPDDITPGANVEFTDGTNIWQASRGAHTGNVWHYTAYLPDGYYNIIAAEVDVDGYTVYLHNPGDYAGTYDCSPNWGVRYYPESTCQGWKVFEQVTLDGEDYGDPTVVDSGLWTDPLEDEVAYSYDFEIHEPPDCHEVTVRYYDDPDCEGWVVYEQTVVDGQDYGDPVIVDQGVWTNPLEQEVVYSHDLTIVEPTDCHDVDVRYYPDQNCEGWWVYEQTVVDGQDYGDPVIVDQGAWTDPFTLETAQSRGLVIEEERDCLPEGNFSIGTSSYCEGESAMVYDTIVGAPYNTTGSLSVLWYYPNGNAFVTGETPLGDVALTVGTNIFSSSLTKEQLIAAIGDNNLTGGNPANDVNYDRLDLYSYVVILRLGEEEITLVSNTEDLWGSCDKPEREIPRCPECGAPIWEQAYDGMALVWFSPTPCVINWEKWCIELTETARGWSQYMFYVEIQGELLPAGEAIGADGNTWYVLEFDPGDGDFILWGADGQGDRFRNYGPVYKYSACSVAPGWQDTTAEGFLIVRNGMNRSDIFEFLIREDDAFFVGEEHRGTLAIEWVNSHLPEGPLVVGTLMELPAISH